MTAIVARHADSADLAMSYLYDPLREYITSDCVRLELLPKSTYNQRPEETEFYNRFFSSSLRVPLSEGVIELAMEEGCRTGIAGMDALHIACAVSADAEEFITTEKTTKPMYRTNLIKVICINP
jgi:hypothetical protein